jgi:hypothetical protein
MTQTAHLDPAYPPTQRARPSHRPIWGAVPNGHSLLSPLSPLFSFLLRSQCQHALDPSTHNLSLTLRRPQCTCTPYHDAPAHQWSPTQIITPHSPSRWQDVLQSLLRDMRKCQEADEMLQRDPHHKLRMLVRAGVTDAKRLEKYLLL